MIDDVRNHKIFYSGTSAGSMIPALEFSALKEDTETMVISPNRTPIFEGLGLVDFLIFPHHNNPEFKKIHSEEISLSTHWKQVNPTLKHNQGIWVQVDCFKIINKTL